MDAPYRICRVTVFREFNSKVQPNGSVLGGRVSFYRPVKIACIRFYTPLTLKQFDQIQTLRKVNHSSQEFADGAFRPTDTFALTACSRNNGAWSKSMAGCMRGPGLASARKEFTFQFQGINGSTAKQRYQLKDTTSTDPPAISPVHSMKAEKWS